MRKTAFEEGLKIGYKQTSAMLTDLKQNEDFSFLKLVDSIALQQSLRDLDTAYKNFFEKRSGYPNFKKKHDNNQRYRTINQNESIRISGKYIKLPKLGFVKFKQSMPVGTIHNATIERTPSGKYFVVLNVDFIPEIRNNNGGIIGIDVGLTHFYTDSNGNVVDNPKYLEKSEKKLAKAQRKLSRKEKGSNNRNKQRIKVALIHEHIANQRNDFLQKLSTAILCKNQTVCVEDLKVQNMIKNHNISKNIASVSWSKFFDMLEYKSYWYGTEFIKIPTTFPSSQLCSECGYQNKDVKDLKIRKWECPECHSVHNRDLNAAVNIKKKGLELKSKS